ncbi:choline dehydrogenase-like flavoprotein [Roseovarius sp. MBR-154]|jgi:choline dehydrogenase-like flavoprotein
MLNRLTDHAPGARLHADVAIIGAGAAGITLARALTGRGLSVCLVESGDADYDPKVQDLAIGEIRGQPYYDLRDARLRFFGGTTAIWGGRCMPLDPIDYRARPWVPLSGWPIDEDMVAPWLREAGAGLGLRFERFDARLREDLDLQEFPLEGAGLGTVFWQFDHAFWRFGLPNCRDLARADDLCILLGATLMDIVTDPQARHVQDLQLAGRDGQRRWLRAGQVVLAAGGIETPRLLLNARGTMPMGLGNAQDQVGRYFMEHPRALIGCVYGQDGLRLWQAYRAFHKAGTKLTPALRLPDAEQEARGVLNAAVTLKYRPNGGRSLLARIYEEARHRGSPNRLVRRIWSMKSLVDRAVVQRAEMALRRAQIAAGAGSFQVMVRAEQAPDPESRITLSARRDALGQPMARLDWRVGAQEVATARAMGEVFGAALDRAGIGGFVRADWLDDAAAGWPTDPTISGHALGGYHHMGTTRMGTDPATSVVDPECRLHGVDNLWIAGSSVFPTGGWSNPTLMIIALSLRLAERVAAEAERTRQPRVLRAVGTGAGPAAGQAARSLG